MEINGFKNPEAGANYDVQESYRLYTQTYENSVPYPGLEVEGLTIEEFDRALADPRSAVYRPDDNLAIPVATPIENLEWYNKSYFKKVAAANGRGTEAPLFYYDHLSTLIRSDNGKFAAALEPALEQVRNRGLLLFDHLEHDSENVVRELGLIFEKLGYIAEDVLPEYDEEARHYHYAARAKLEDIGRVREKPLEMWEANLACLEENVYDESQIKVHQTLSEEEGKEIWEFYKPTFDTLSEHDPIKANSPFEELMQLLTDQRITKIVQRDSDEVVSLCWFSDVRIIPWANQRYYQLYFPEEYEEGHIFFFPGVVTKPGSNGKGHHVMARVAHLMNGAGIEAPVLTFVCNKISRRHVPRIGNWALNRAGLNIELGQTVCERVFRALAIR